jgi:hypothetical protein
MEPMVVINRAARYDELAADCLAFIKLAPIRL